MRRNTTALREFMARLDRFAFYPELEAALARRGERLQALRDAGRFGEILDCLLDPGAMGYAALPKGLVPFHRYADDCRTPVAEHLLEACRYVRDRTGMVRVHFTVSPEHWAEVEDHVAAMCRRYEDRETSFDVTLSPQRPDTDTLAATLDNRPFREPDGSLALRPGGHGSLLANLNDLAADVVFIQNVDNVAVYAGAAVRYRKALAGLLVELQARVFHYLDGLHAGPSAALVDEAARFARDTLSVAPPESLAGAPADRRVGFLRETLDRPLRVCGMVPSAGEPGGGPFWVRAGDGACSLQIVESSQVDMEEPRQHGRSSPRPPTSIPWISCAASAGPPARASTSCASATRGAPSSPSSPAGHANSRPWSTPACGTAPWRAGTRCSSRFPPRPSRR